MRRVRSTALLPALLLMAGCETPFTTLFGASGEARSLAAFGWVLSIVMTLTTLVVAGIIVWGIRRRRGSLDEHLPIDAGGGKRWILIGGVLLPILALSVLYVTTLVALNRIPGGRETADLEFDVTAHQWWWQIEYLDDDLQRRFPTANELHIPVGRDVRINLRSVDVIHSFWVPRLHGKLDMIPGHTNHLILRADAVGTYWGECAEYCGVQHAHMRFLVIVETPEAFEAWLERQRRPATPPVDSALLTGQRLFEEYACAMCHAIRGTRARGGVAPDLTHVGSRRTLAAGTLPNTRARLQAWIVNAQSLKPGAKMPTLDQFTGDELNALAAYLESLK